MIDEEVEGRIAAIFAGQAPWAALPAVAERKRTLLFAAAQNIGSGDALARLWWHPALTAEAARPSPVLPQLGVQTGNTLPDALYQLARYHQNWVRDPEEWPGGSVGSLARHLLVDTLWPPPMFLDEAWLRSPNPQDDGWREAFVRIGAGQGIQKIPLGVPLTEKGRHFLLLANPKLPLIHAVRYGQVRALGGSERLVEALCETRLGMQQPDEPFWETVIAFFVRHAAKLPESQIGPIIDFLGYQKEIEPTLSMKGRTTDALLARVDDWHAALARLSSGSRRNWRSLGLSPFTRTEDAPGKVTLTWTVVELLDTQSLQQEGSELRHCVRTYDAKCLKGEKAIFSLRLRASDNRVTRRMLTIEVDPRRRAVVQVRGNANSLPKEQRPESRLRRAGAIVREWSRERHLGVSCTF
ncbi:MAG: PcfJ domain-containing protein [Armatimonas sp.]